MAMKEVFRSNFKEEEARLLLTLSQYKSIAFDTEFPGFLAETPRNAGDVRQYQGLKSNVERTKLIQVGFTVFDAETGFVGGVWQFNMSGFNPKVDEHSQDSIKMLENCGIDFAGNLSNGVGMIKFVGLLKKIREMYGEAIQWVTFHGLYDVAYLIVSMIGNWKLPADLEGFVKSAGEFFCGGIYDVKYMAGEHNYMGLEKFAKVLGEIRDQGVAHQAGSDSLLTAKVFAKTVRTIKEWHGVSYKMYEGAMYGITLPIPSARRLIALSSPASCRRGGLTPYGYSVASFPSALRVKRLAYGFNGCDYSAATFAAPLGARRLLRLGYGCNGLQNVVLLS